MPPKKAAKKATKKKVVKKAAKKAAKKPAKKPRKRSCGETISFPAIKKPIIAAITPAVN